MISWCYGVNALDFTAHEIHLAERRGPGRHGVIC